MICIALICLFGLQICLLIIFLRVISLRLLCPFYLYVMFFVFFVCMFACICLTDVVIVIHVDKKLSRAYVTSTLIFHKINVYAYVFVYETSLLPHYRIQNSTQRTQDVNNATHPDM